MTFEEAEKKFGRDYSHVSVWVLEGIEVRDWRKMEWWKKKKVLMKWDRLAQWEKTLDKLEKAGKESLFESYCRDHAEKETLRYKYGRHIV